MRRLDETPIDPEIEATLDAIDATLAGEPVDPRFAEVAELALLLAAERPRPRAQFADALDARVQRRFAPEPAGGHAATARPPRSRGWFAPWMAGLGGLVAAGVALIVVIGLVGGGSGRGPIEGSASSSAGASSVPRARQHALEGLPSVSGAAASPDAIRSFAPSSRTLYGPAVPQNGRKVVQSAELDLATAPNRIDTVAQEVFDAVGAAGGIVDSSSVTQTGGLDGSANFQLRIPSAELATTMARLSQLRYAQVLARTDNSHDVNGQYVSVTHALADAQALRTALLKRLANAYTTAQIDSLNARIHDAEAAIAADQAQLRSLNSQINYSQVTVTIAARQGAAPPSWPPAWRSSPWPCCCPRGSWPRCWPGWPAQCAGAGASRPSTWPDRV